MKVLTESSHGEEEESAIANSRDRFVKQKKKDYGVELPNEYHRQTHASPCPTH